MKSILEYNDYRSYIQDYYTEMKARHLMSWRIFAKQAGFVSPSYIKLVCENKTNLSDEGIDQLSKAMGLRGYEVEFFKLLVHLNQAKLIEEKQKILIQAANFAQKYKVNILNRDMFSYFSNWLNPVLRELAPDVSSIKVSEIARRFVPHVTGAEVRKSLRFLVSNGFLIQNENGTYRQAEKNLASDNKDITMAALRELHRQVGTLALDALNNVPVNERDFSEVIMGVTKNAYDKILAEIADFRKRVIAIATQEDGIDRVYSLNIQMIPLTHKNTGKNFDKKKQEKSEKDI